MNQPQATTASPRSAAAAILRLADISKVYRTDRMETLALNNINLEVREGEFISIMGPSGCGKSTLLHIMGLIDDCTKGHVELQGRALNRIPDKELARIRNEEIGFVFQSFHLINDLKVLDNVEIPLLYRRGLNGNRSELARAALERVGLTARMKHYPSQLSGGQQQRVAIARAVVGKPRLLLADEPTGNLDSKMGTEIMEILRKLNEDEGTTIVMVTHDEHLAKQTDRIVRLFDGRQVQ